MATSDLRQRRLDTQIDSQTLGEAIPIPQSDEETDFGIPDALRNSELHKEWMNRVASGRDIRVVISASDAATGVGKTTLAVNLALLWDPHGWDASEKSTLDPREFSVRYDQTEKLSVMLLDDAEQALEKRRSMSNEVLAVGHDFATKRYRQIMGILTLPSKGMIDSRIADLLSDYWILVEDVGEASVYRFETNDFTGNVRTRKVENISWPPLDGHPEYEEVERQKVNWMTGETESRYVLREEFEDAKENFWNKATAKRSYEFINRAYDLAQSNDTELSLTQSDIGEIAGMSQPNVSKIVNSESFEDFYTTYKE